MDFLEAKGKVCLTNIDFIELLIQHDLYICLDVMCDGVRYAIYII